MVIAVAATPQHGPFHEETLDIIRGAHRIHEPAAPSLTQAGVLEGGRFSPQPLLGSRIRESSGRSPALARARRSASHHGNMEDAS